MKLIGIFLGSLLSLNLVGQTDMEINQDFFNHLNQEEKRVIVDKGTEQPFSGEYNDHYESGTYVCKACNSPLYKSTDKFKSGCGWPSFDDEISAAILECQQPCLWGNSLRVKKTPFYYIGLRQISGLT